MRLFRQRWLVAILSIIGGGSVWAADYPSEQDYLQEFPVVLSASRLAQPVSEAPNAMTVIDREMIAASGFRDIADLFRLVPGMYVGAVDGHTPIVAYHGATDQYSRRMQVLVDGRSVYLPPFSSVNWEDIPLHMADIERIEVIRGPAAASHGANSLQGAINIITRDAASVNGGSISVSKGEGGISDVSAHVGRTGDELDYRITLGYRADEGFDTVPLNDSYATRLANLRANYRPGNSDSFDLQLGYQEGVKGVGVVGRATDPFRDARASSDFQQLTWLHVRPQGDEVKLHYYHVRRNSADIGGVLKPAENTAVDRHEVELQHTAQLGDSNRLVWGGGVRYDSVDSPVHLTIPQTLHQSRLFAHDEWRLTQSALLNVGAMLEDSGMGHRNTSPRISLNYHLTPQHTLRAGASVAYRNPAILEEKGRSIVTPPPQWFLSAGGLRPEKMLSREIGYLGEFSATGVTVDARIYSDQVSDIIFIDPRTLVFGGRPYSFRNLLSANYRGVEGTLKYRWNVRSSLVFNYARQHASCSVTGTLTQPVFLPILQTGYADVYSSTVPLNSGSILLDQQMMHDLRFSAGYYYQEQVQVLDAQQTQPVQRRLDLRIAKTFGQPGKNGGGGLALVLQNILQDDHTEYSAVPQTNSVVMFNKRAYITATFNF